MVMHVYNELNLSRRTIRIAIFVQKLMDEKELKHLDLEKKFENSTLPTQLRVLEYYLNSLNSSYKDFGSKKTVTQRIEHLENVLTAYGYQNDLSLT
jgi:hypothetical protein